MSVVAFAKCGSDEERKLQFASRLLNQQMHLTRTARRKRTLGSLARLAPLRSHLTATAVKKPYSCSPTSVVCGLRRALRMRRKHTDTPQPQDRMEALPWLFPRGLPLLGCLISPPGRPSAMEPEARKMPCFAGETGGVAPAPITPPGSNGCLSVSAISSIPMLMLPSAAAWLSSCVSRGAKRR